jgi:hypothetical protein
VTRYPTRAGRSTPYGVLTATVTSCTRAAAGKRATAGPAAYGWGGGRVPGGFWTGGSWPVG